MDQEKDADTEDQQERGEKKPDAQMQVTDDGVEAFVHANWWNLKLTQP